MNQMLADQETDLAIILTEGIIKGITDGNPSKIAQEYISTPLLWGIHVAANSSYKTLSGLKGSKAAISRFGSGSHLMAYIKGQNEHWNTDDLKFEVIQNLQGAVTALTEGSADYFMWEHFTTKPLVDNGIFRNIGDCPTPWPCFVIATTNAFAEENAGTLKHILEVINLYTQEFKLIPSINRTLANAYIQNLEDINAWLAITRWGQQQMSKETVEKVQNTLLQLGLIDHKLAVHQLLTTQ